ncbi:MAG: RNA binding, partial [Trebouxia sp. A1-2]
VSNLRPVLPPIPDLQGKDVRANWNAVALAFLGDTVWELYARRRFFYPPTKTSKYYESVMGEVCAEAQERYLEQLMAGPVLSAEEKDVIRWGNNAKITIPKRFSQSGKHAQTYRAATAIECLIAMVIDLAHGFMHAIWATHVAMAMGHPKSEVALGNLPIC